MTFALRELRRNTRRFVPTTAALALLVLLLLMLGGLLDGLYLGSTGALRAQDADLVVSSTTSRDSVIRSRIDAATRATVEAVPGVERASGLGFALVGARVPGETEIADTAVAGYEGGVDGVPAPPPRGTAWADDSLEAAGVEVGDRLLLGPTRVPLRVRGFVDDTSFLQQGALWVDPETWRKVLDESRPGSGVGPETFQVLAVRAEPGVDVERLARRIDRATDGATSTLTLDDAILALPGIEQQNATFSQIIGVTFVVAGLVVALFFALLTLERVKIFAVLKAVGASSRQLVSGLLVQALIVSAIAFVVGGALALLLSLFVPPQVPLQLTVGRAVFVAVGTLVTALIGGAISMRRIIKVDPASLVGAGV